MFGLFNEWESLPFVWRHPLTAGILELLADPEVSVRAEAARSAARGRRYVPFSLQPHFGAALLRCVSESDPELVKAATWGLFQYHLALPPQLRQDVLRWMVTPNRIRNPDSWYMERYYRIQLLTSLAGDDPLEHVLNGAVPIGEGKENPWDRSRIAAEVFRTFDPNTRQRAVRALLKKLNAAAPDSSPLFLLTLQAIADLVPDQLLHETWMTLRKGLPAASDRLRSGLLRTLWILGIRHSDGCANDALKLIFEGDTSQTEDEIRLLANFVARFAARIPPAYWPILERRLADLSEDPAARGSYDFAKAGAHSISFLSSSSQRLFVERAIRMAPRSEFERHCGIYDLLPNVGRLVPRELIPHLFRRFFEAFRAHQAYYDPRRKQEAGLRQDETELDPLPDIPGEIVTAFLSTSSGKPLDRLPSIQALGKLKWALTAEERRAVSTRLIDLLDDPDNAVRNRSTYLLGDFARSLDQARLEHLISLLLPRLSDKNYIGAEAAQKALTQVFEATRPSPEVINQVVAGCRSAGAGPNYAAFGLLHSLARQSSDIDRGAIVQYLVECLFQPTSGVSMPHSLIWACRELSKCAGSLPQESMRRVIEGFAHAATTPLDASRGSSEYYRAEILWLMEKTADAATTDLHVEAAQAAFAILRANEFHERSYAHESLSSLARLIIPAIGRPGAPVADDVCEIMLRQTGGENPEAAAFCLELCLRLWRHLSETIRFAVVTRATTFWSHDYAAARVAGIKVWTAWVRRTGSSATDAHLQVFEELLDDPEGTVRAAAVAAVGWLCSRTSPDRAALSLEKVVPCLADWTPQVRQAIPTALRLLASRLTGAHRIWVLETLGGLVEDPDGVVRVGAARELALMESMAVDSESARGATPGRALAWALPEPHD